MTATRYYTINGTTVAERTTTVGTTTNGTIYWLLGDAQGTATIAVNSTNGTPTWDRYLPYGGNRNTTYTLPIDHGWLGQTHDTTTGLDYLTNRYYDSTLIHFISTQPLNNTTSPEAANTYTYANDKPTSFVDASGLYAVWDPNGGGYTCFDGCSSAAPWETGYSTGSTPPSPSYGGSPRYNPTTRQLTHPNVVNPSSSGGSGTASLGGLAPIFKPGRPASSDIFFKAINAVHDFYSGFPLARRWGAVIVGHTNDGRVIAFASKSANATVIKRLMELNVPIYQLQGEYRDDAHAELAMEK